MTTYVKHFDWEEDDADVSEVVIQSHDEENFLSFENFKDGQHVNFDDMLVFGRKEAKQLYKMLGKVFKE